jgi:hypothetical protein
MLKPQFFVAVFAGIEIDQQRSAGRVQVADARVTAYHNTDVKLGVAVPDPQ